jgi:hypothetical protein
MNRQVFPFIALGLGLMIVVVLFLGGVLGGERLMPLLAALLMTEFGFILSLVGVYLGIQAVKDGKQSLPVIAATLGCVLLAVFFGWTGLALWPAASAI